MKKILALVLSLMMVISFCAFASAEEATWHLGILVHGLENEFWAQEANGAILFADSHDDVDYQVMVTDGDDNKENQAIRDYIAQYGDHAFFVTDVASTANSINAVEICEEAGCYVTVLWQHAEGLEVADYEHFAAFLTADDFTSGYTTAKYLFEQLGGEGKVCALYGVQGEDSAANRYRGFQAALEEYPGIEMLDMQVASWSQDQAMSFTQTWLSTYEQIDAIWSANDTMGLGAIEALKLEGLNGKVLVNGIDGIAAAYDAVLSGDMTCFIANNGWMLMGYGAAYAYEAAVNGVQVERPIIQINTPLITGDNVEEMKAQFIDGKPDYDFTDLSFCVMADYETFEEMAAQ